MDAFTLGKQLNITDDKILRKAEELIRLTRVRAPHGIGVSETCKGVICLDLASSVFNKLFDRKNAMALASITTKDYQLAYNSLQNILQIRPNLSFEELSSQFDCPKFAPECQTFFEGYKEKFLATVEEHRRPYADFSKPVFNSVAFFIVAKLNKLSIDRNKLMEIGIFSPREFQSVYDSMTTLCEVVFPAHETSNQQKRKRENQPCEESEEKKAKNAAYEEWKKKALAKEEPQQQPEQTKPQEQPPEEKLPQESEESDRNQYLSLTQNLEPLPESEPVNDENSPKNINHDTHPADKPKPKLKQMTLFFKPVQKDDSKQSIRTISTSIEANNSSQTD